jgi:hypothetical protein
VLAAAFQHPHPPGHATHWPNWRRRHQARSCWFHQRTRLNSHQRPTPAIAARPPAWPGSRSRRRTRQPAPPTPRRCGRRCGGGTARPARRPRWPGSRQQRGQPGGGEYHRGYGTRWQPGPGRSQQLALCDYQAGQPGDLGGGRCAQPRQPHPMREQATRIRPYRRNPQRDDHGGAPGHRPCPPSRQPPPPGHRPRCARGGGGILAGAAGAGERVSHEDAAPDDASARAPGSTGEECDLAFWSVTGRMIPHRMLACLLGVAWARSRWLPGCGSVVAEATVSTPIMVYGQDLCRSRRALGRPGVAASRCGLPAAGAGSDRERDPGQLFGDCP